MTVQIIIDGQTHKREVPTSWGNPNDFVTFGQFLKLDDCGQDIVKVISLLTQVDYSTLLRSRIVRMDDLVQTLSFLKSKPEPVIPKTILGYPVPINLEFEQVQMYLDLKNYVAEASKLTPLQQLESYTLYCAVYACITKHGKYDFKLAEAMKDEFLNAPCTEVMGIGNFTLVRLIGLNLSIKPSFPKAGSRLTRFRLGLTAFRLRSAHFLQSLISKRQPATKNQRFLNGS